MLMGQISCAAQESYARFEKTGKLELSPQLLQLEKLAICSPLPDSPADDLIGAYSGFSTPRSSASVPRTRSSNLRPSQAARGPLVSHSCPTKG